MKKHLSLLVLFAMTLFRVYAQPTSAAPTPPARSASNVVSLFSDAYTNVSGSNFAPNWGEQTEVSDVTIAGNATKFYSNLSYQGLELASSIDVSSMSNLHMDLWTSDVTALNVFLINTSPATVQQDVVVNPTANGWYSIDIPLSSYPIVNLANIGQMMFTGSGNFYLDNLYFWKSANSPSLSNFSIPSKVFGAAPFAITAPTSNSNGAFSYSSSNTSVATVSGSTITLTGVGSTVITATQAASGSFSSGTISATLVVTSPPPATAAPTPPARSAGNVISMFSNAYQNVTIDTWSAVWDQADVSDVTVSGNATKLYNNLNYAGVEFTSATINATNMEKFHIDVWTPDATVFKVKLVDFGADGAYGGGDDAEHEIGYIPTLSSWNSYDIPMTDFTNLVTRGHLAQMIFVASVSTVYIDNVYFWRSAPAPTFGTFTVPAKAVGAAAFSLTAPTSNSTGAFSYTSSNTNVATISGSTVTVVGAGTSVITATQAAAGAYGSGSVTANLVVTGPAAPTSAAPNPTPRNAGDVISLFSGAYTNVSGTDWFPYWGQNAFCQDTTIAGNLTHKYPNLNYHGVQFADAIDASSMTKLHFDIWTADCQAFDFYLINTNVGFERKITVTPPFAGWRSYDIDLTQFSSQGVDMANIGQFKFVSTPFGGTNVYIDNIYFWKPSNVPSISNFFIPGKYLGDPTFTLSTPTSNSAGAFTYTSSNTAVATISGNVVTIVGVGSSTITATQAAAGGLLSGSITAILNVDYAPPSSAAPIPPVRNTADVISLFSNAYTNVTVDTWSAVWDQANVSDVQIASNSTKKYSNLVFAGVEFTSNPVDASAMQTFHIDVWTPNSANFNIKLVDFGADGSYGGGDDSESELSYTPTLNGWNSYDIPMSSFSGLAARAHLAQMIFVASNSTVYVDNVYFHKGTALSPTIAITQPTCSVATGTVTVTSSTTGLTFSKDGVTYQSSNVFSGLVVGSYNITSKTSGGVVSSPVVATILGTTPPAPAGIVGTKNVSKCDSLQTYSVVNPVYGYTYTWAVTGTGNSVKTGQGSSSAVIALNVAGTVSVKATKCTAAGPTASFAVTKATPSTPSGIYQSFVGSTSVAADVNLCKYTQSAFASTGVKDTFRIRTIAFATGYYFQVPGGASMTRVNDTTIAVVFADTTSAGATIKAYSLSACDTSLAKVLTLTRGVAATPSGIYTSFNPNSTSGPVAVTSVCSLVGGGSSTYMIRKVVTAQSYIWSLRRGTNASLTRLATAGINDTSYRVTFAAGFTKDTLEVKSVNGCGVSVAKSVILNALLAPPAISTLTAGSGNTTPCIGNSVTYTAVALAPTTSQAAVAVFRWTKPNFTTITGATADSSSITLSYNTGFTGGSISVKPQSACGIAGSAKTMALQYLPPTPTAITSSTGVYNFCIGSTATFTATVAAPSSSQRAAVVYRWTKPNNTVIVSAASDSSSITLQFNTGYTGGSVTVKGQTACGAQGTAKSQSITHTGCPAGTKLIAGNGTEINDVQATVYPSPSNGNFTVNIATGMEQSGTAQIQLIDMYGKVVAQYSATNNAGRIVRAISNNKLADGMYTIKYTFGNTSGVTKMMIHH